MINYGLINMNTNGSRGVHIFLDYINYNPPTQEDGKWMLKILRNCIKKAGVKEVHAHVVEFDGANSPPGFAAVVLVDESHVTAHCYSEIGILAIDVFTCGKNDPQVIVDELKIILSKSIDNLNLVREESVKRFLLKGD